MATLGTFVAGQVLTAAELNAIGTWTTYTPTPTNFVIGSVFYSQYVQLNDLIIWSAAVSVSSASAGAVALSLPVATTGAIFNVGGQGSGMWYDANLVDSYILAPYTPTTTTVSFYLANSTAPGVLNGSSLAVSDEISLTMIYRGA